MTSRNVLSNTIGNRALESKIIRVKRSVHSFIKYWVLGSVKVKIKVITLLPPRLS